MCDYCCCDGGQYSYRILTWTMFNISKCKSIDVAQQETGGNGANPSIMYTFVDDFSHIECQLINKRKHKLEIVCLQLIASKCLQTEINRWTKNKMRDGCLQNQTQSYDLHVVFVVVRNHIIIPFDSGQEKKCFFFTWNLLYRKSMVSFFLSVHVL